MALTINGETKTVKTYAMSVDRLLEQQGLTVSTHDIVTSTHNGAIENGDSVTYCQAFETTLSINGASVPFWSCASSAQELLNFFSESEREAMSIKIDIANAYNQLTGGFTISGGGPVTVIVDGKSTTIDGGNRTAASLLDACGIILGSNDRVSVEQDGDTTILRVQRVTYGTRTQDVTTPYSTQYITDASLAPGEQKVERAGTDGIVTQTLQVTYVDGVEESSSVTSETTKQLEVDEVIGVGPAQTQPEAQSSDSSGSSSSSSSSSSDSSNSSSTGNSSSSDDSSSSDAATSSSSASSSASASASASPSPSDSASQSPSPSASESDTPTPAESSTPAQTPTETPTPTQTPTENPTQPPKPTTNQ
ncbi:ubiquitin-like domain-containing protein [Pseudoscardovia suis]